MIRGSSFFLSSRCGSARSWYTPRSASSTTLNRLFQKKIGRSPGQYLLEYRLQQSEKLLQMGMTVKQTALSCGFEDPFYYSRVFRKHYGMPPSDYRLQFAEIQ